MRRLVATAALCLVLSLPLTAQQAERPESGARQRVHFEAVDIFIDCGEKHLAAYQFELKTVRGDVMIVGIEGGDHPAFRDPPYYDPAALRNDRVIVADFDTGGGLPTGRVRAARVHVRVRGKKEPRYKAVLETAAGPGGHSIEASVTLERKTR